MFSKIVKYSNNIISTTPIYNQHWLSTIQDKTKLEESLGLMDYDLSKTIPLEVSKNNEEPKKTEDIINLLLEKEQTIFVTGELGAGKTAWLLKIWENLLQRTDIPIPVFVRLGKFNEIPGADFETKLINYLFLKNKSLLSKEEITNNLHSGKFILLLDGLDEIDKKTCSAELIKNYSELNNLKTITTSRPDDSNSNNHKITSVNIEKIYEYCLKNNSLDIYEAIRKREEIIDICTNPLMFKLLFNEIQYSLKELEGQRFLLHSWERAWWEGDDKSFILEEIILKNKFQLLEKIINNIIARESTEKQKYDKEYKNELNRYYMLQSLRELPIVSKIPQVLNDFIDYIYNPIDAKKFKSSLFNGNEFMHLGIQEYYYTLTITLGLEKIYSGNFNLKERISWLFWASFEALSSRDLLADYLKDQEILLSKMINDYISYFNIVNHNIHKTNFTFYFCNNPPKLFDKNNFMSEVTLDIEDLTYESHQIVSSLIRRKFPKEIALKYPHTCWMYRSEETTQELLNAGSNREQENRELTEKSLTELIKNNEKRTILDIAISGNIQIKNKTYLLSDNTRAKYIISYLQLNPEPNKELAEILNNNVHLLEESLNQPNTIYLTLLDNINITDKFIGPKDQDIRKETVKLFKLFIQNRDEDPLTIKNNILKNINQNFKHNIKEVLDYLTSNILSPDNNHIVEELINLIKQCIFNMDYISIDSVIENTYKNKEK